MCDQDEGLSVPRGPREQDEASSSGWSPEVFLKAGACLDRALLNIS